MNNGIPTVRGTVRNNIFYFECEKCSEFFYKNGNPRTKPKIKVHTHGAPDNNISKNNHRVQHCINKKNYPRGYFLALINRDCDICHNTGRAYWSDGITGSCFHCDRGTIYNIEPEEE